MVRRLADELLSFSQRYGPEEGGVDAGGHLGDFALIGVVQLHHVVAVARSGSHECVRGFCHIDTHVCTEDPDPPTSDEPGFCGFAPDIDF